MKINKIERKVAPLKRFLSFFPYFIVTVVARIKGNITEDMLTEVRTVMRSLLKGEDLVRVSAS